MSLLTEAFGENVADLKLKDVKKLIRKLEGLNQKVRSLMLTEYGKITGTGLGKSDYEDLEVEEQPKAKKK